MPEKVAPLKKKYKNDELVAQIGIPNFVIYQSENGLLITNKKGKPLKYSERKIQ